MKPEDSKISCWDCQALPKVDPGLAQAESPFYVGRAVAALACDPNIMERTGHALSAGQLARVYGFTDLNGNQPISYPGEGAFRGNQDFIVRVLNEPLDLGG